MREVIEISFFMREVRHFSVSVREESGIYHSCVREEFIVCVREKFIVYVRKEFIACVRGEKDIYCMCER